MRARTAPLTWVVYCAIMLLAACGPRGYIYVGGTKVPQGQFLADQQIYQAYRDQNTLEGYRDFIRKYPKNCFLGRARDEILLLEFKPYEQQDTVDGYLEFKMLYPNSPYVDKANTHIEQLEIRRYDSLDTIAGYREFLDKYPRSFFSNSARERLQELTFREQDQLLRERCGFDLLAYRHKIRKAGASQDPLWNFTVFAYVREQNSKTFFVTRLLYGTPPDLQGDPEREQLKTTVVSRLLGIIAEQSRSGARLPHLFFEICHAPEGLNENAVPMLSYEVPPDGLRQLIAGQRQPHEILILAQAMPAPAPPAKSATVTARHTDVVSVPSTNPVDIMGRVANSNTFTDAVLSRHWETTFSDGRTQAISVIEKHRRYDSQNAIRSATVLRYLETRKTRSDTRRCASAILHQRSLKAEDRYWYIMDKGDAGITTHIDVYRPDAENAFYLEQYVDRAPETESHELLEIVTNDNRPAALIKSTPLNAKPYYAWRRSLIDLERLVPLMIEYYDAQGTLQKDVLFSWQQSFGVWYWDIAMFRNLADGSTTRITTTDIRINLDLPERDFQPGALSRLAGK